MSTAQPGQPPVLIVGAAGGIGSALARMLAADGVPLALVARDSARLHELGRELGAPVWTCDVMETNLLTDAVRAACADGVSGLAYCVGSIVLGSLRTARAETFLEVFRRDVVGAFTAVQAAQDALMHASGSVVLFSSVAARLGFPNHAVIAAAKAGIEGLVRALAADLAPRVRVNAIAPSLTETPLALPLLSSPAAAETLARLHPIPRLGQAADMASLAAFLLGPRAGWITGQIIGVDGGRSSVQRKSA